MPGPLAGYRILEVASIGPGPFCAMMLADMGAEVIRIDPTAATRRAAAAPNDVMARGRRSIAIDLKHPDGVEIVMQLVETADGLIEGFRPGVAERLGIGPDECWNRNPGLVFGRMTGWGQTGPLASTAGHDIDYIAVSGVLGAIGRAGEPPVPPLNLVGDFGGGGLMLAFGMACGLLEAKESGLGQVIDAAMTDGSAVLSTFVYGLAASGLWDLDHRGVNMLDTGAPWYDTYETSDGQFVAVGAIEPQFYAELLKGLQLEDRELPGQHDAEHWPQLRSELATAFLRKTRAEWTAVFAESDACVAPVMTLAEAHQHPHNVERSTFVEIGGVIQPAPAPRFSRSQADIPKPAAAPGTHSDVILDELGLTPDAIADLKVRGAVG